jgi:hypothetical protein
VVGGLLVAAAARDVGADAEGRHWEMGWLDAGTRFHLGVGERVVFFFETMAEY